MRLGLLALIAAFVSFVHESSVAMANFQEVQGSLLLSDGNFIYPREDTKPALLATFDNVQGNDTATAIARASEVNQAFVNLAEEYTTAPQVLVTLLTMEPDDSEFDSSQVSQDANWLGLSDIGINGFWEQGEWAASRLSEGFYAFYNRQQNINLVLRDGTEILVLAQNAATYAIQYYFAGVAANQAEWAELTGQGEESFYHAYQLLFGDPTEGLLHAAHPGIAELTALATLKLPWTAGETWNLTGGPHGANLSGLDWQPSGIASGCNDTIDESHWVVAAASGKAVSDESSYFLKLDHDSDGNISTGWQSVYGHTANKQIIDGANVVQGQNRVCLELCVNTFQGWLSHHSANRPSNRMAS